jgi:DNA primase
MAVITHPEKVLFPDDGITKGELAAYYETIAPIMLPHIRGRPVTMERFHRGIAEKGFIQKNVSKGFPKWLERVEVPKKGGSVHYPLANDTQSLLWLANQNSITPHVFGATFAAVYAVRPKPGAPVSAPCTWAEVASREANPRAFTLRGMASRIDEVGDLWSEMRAHSLDRALERLHQM